MSGVFYLHCAAPILADGEAAAFTPPLPSPPPPRSISEQRAWDVIKYKRLNLLDQPAHFSVKLSK